MYFKIINYCTNFLMKMASSRHDSDKENAHRTRIPLPKDPLPALPKHLLETKKPQIVPLRCPLKTLNAQIYPVAGPSKEVPHKPQENLKIDSRHVTLRKKNEDLDWHYTVFREERVGGNNASIISISDDEKYLEDQDSERHFVNNNKRKHTLGAALSVVTPSVKACLESNRVRNIKRSLKRPHSRELQGLSSGAAARPDKLDDKVKRRLQFNESLLDRLGTPDYWKVKYMRCLNRDYTSDVYDHLLVSERKPLELPRISSITRACVINWLMKVNGADGNPAVIQAACWYLDTILGTGHVQLDKLQLVAAACYWIAQKLHGPFMPAMRLVKCSNMAFTPERLLHAEKAVLARLKFPQQPVVAQDFITYLSWVCEPHNAGEIEVAATFLAMCGLMVDRVLCDEFPSVIAAAAVRNALLLLRKRDLMPRLLSCHVFKAAEKKATSMSFTCSILRRAVRTVAAPLYEYKAPFEHYSMPPCCIAQRVINAANDLTIIDARNTDRR